MFKFIQKIDERLYARYITLDGNIKSACNSFYDAYLDFLEQFVKSVAVSFDVDLNARETCGGILRKDAVVQIFKDRLGLDDYTFGKMQDYTLKVNAHKHKGEKHIQIDTVVAYMRVIYDALAAYCKYKGIETEAFDAAYFIHNFGIYEKENSELKQEAAALKEELRASAEQHRLKENDIKTFKSLLSQSEVDKLSLEEQNRELQSQISKLKDIKLNSMEEKLNKTIDLLLELKPAIEENRIIVRAVGSRIGGILTGDKDVDAWIERERKKRTE